MTDRVIVYPGSGVQDTDILRLQMYQRRAVNYLARMALSPAANAGIVWNFVPQSVSGLTVTLSDGVIVGPMILEDATAYGSLGGSGYDTTPVATVPGVTVVGPFPNTATAGQSVNHVIYATVSIVDADFQVLYYANPDNVTQVLRGVNNSGLGQATTRKELVTISFVAGTPGTTGSQATPAVPTGGIPMYVVTLASGDTAINLANVTQHPASPFFPGLEQLWAGNPNGHVAGNASKAGMAPSLCYDTTNNIHYTCVQTGSAATAVWVAPAVNTGPAGRGITNLDTVTIGPNLVLRATFTDGTQEDIAPLPPGPAGPAGPAGAAGPAGQYTGSYQSVSVHTTYGSHTMSATTNKFRLRIAGGGGGGGGSLVNNYAGGGGGAGAYAEVDFTCSPGETFTVAVGGGGNGGAPGYTAGSGLDSYIIDGAGEELIRCQGGRGGNSNVTGNSAGGSGGIVVLNNVTATNNRAISGIWNVTGGDGGDGQSGPVNGQTIYGGNGGAGARGGAGRAGTTGSGTPGKAFTGGGGGGSYLGTGNGAPGGSGIVIIEEYH